MVEVVFPGGPLQGELGSCEFELGLVDEEDAEGEELGVAVAVGATVEDLDFVVRSFDRSADTAEGVSAPAAASAVPIGFGVLP